MTKTDTRMELLAPAGSFESLRTAVLYGADAVYLGGEMYGLRAKARNFGKEELAQAVSFAHQHNVKVYVTVNIIAHNEHLTGIEEYLQYLYEIGVDALIMADVGLIQIARTTVPNMEIHLSTQASATNYQTFLFWAAQGVKRIVAAREISLAEMNEIREKIPKDLTIEAFAHGAMCISISGRCLLSTYLSGRDSNLGLCSQPCRWSYRLMEETRPGEYFPISEGEEGTYIFNSKDLCMVEYLPEMQKAGIGSIKIEGRMKTPLYVAMVTKVYREALDDLASDPSLYESKKEYYKEQLCMVSHRDYTTGFYLGKPGTEDQIYSSTSYIKQIDFAGKVLRIVGESILVEQRGKFLRGDELVLLWQKGDLRPVKASYIRAEDGTEQESAPHAQQKVWIPRPEGEMIPEGTILVRKI